MPFVDMELTDGIITVMTDHLNKIKDAANIHQLIPCISSMVVEDIMAIIRDIFEKEYMS